MVTTGAMVVVPSFGSTNPGGDARKATEGAPGW